VASIRLSSFGSVLALLLLAGCAERLTVCHCILLDYAYEKRAKDAEVQETDSASACDCSANRKRSDENAPVPNLKEKTYVDER